MASQNLGPENDDALVEVVIADEVPAGEAVANHENVGRVLVGGEEQYYVEAVVDYFVNKLKQDWYRVKWSGWDSSFNTWENSENIEQNSPALVEEFFAENPVKRVRKRNVILFEEARRRKAESAKKEKPLEFAKLKSPKRRILVSKNRPRGVKLNPLGTRSRVQPTRKKKPKTIFPSPEDGDGSSSTKQFVPVTGVENYEKATTSTASCVPQLGETGDAEFAFIPSFDGTSVGIVLHQPQTNCKDLIIDGILIDKQAKDFYKWLYNGKTDDLNEFVEDHTETTAQMTTSPNPNTNAADDSYYFGTMSPAELSPRDPDIEVPMNMDIFRPKHTSSPSNQVVGEERKIQPFENVMNGQRIPTLMLDEDPFEDGPIEFGSILNMNFY